MYMQTIGPAPELQDERKPQAGPRPAPELLVQYPQSEPIAVTLPERSLWDDIASAAKRRRSIVADRAGHLAESQAAVEAAPTPRLGSASSWIAVGTGLALVAAFWSAILF